MKLIKKIFSSAENNYKSNNIYDIKYESDIKLLDSHELLFIYFYNLNCNACKRSNLIINNLDSLFEDKIKFIKINLDIDNNLKLFKKYNIKSTPSYIIKRQGIIIKDASTFDSIEDAILQIKCILQD